MDIFRYDMPHSDEVDSTRHLPELAQLALEIYGIIDFDLDPELSDEERTLRLLEHFDDQECYLMTDEDGEIVAVANIEEQYHDEPTLWTQGLAVAPKYQGAGIGSEFAEYLENVAKQRGLRRLGSRATKTSVNFHMQIGFAPYDDPDPITGKILMYKYI